MNLPRCFHHYFRKASPCLLLYQWFLFCVFEDCSWPYVYKSRFNFKKNNSSFLSRCEIVESEKSTLYWWKLSNKRRKKERIVQDNLSSHWKGRKVFEDKLQACFKVCHFSDSWSLKWRFWLSFNGIILRPWKGDQLILLLHEMTSIIIITKKA